MTPIEIGVSVVDARRLAALASLWRLDIAALIDFLGLEEKTSWPPAEWRATHLYFGSEFCEHLFPERDALKQALDVADRLGMTPVLTTPIANDALVATILETAAWLPSTVEIVVSEWGVAHALHTANTGHTLIAGRQVAKMLKDPRIASPAWMKPYPSGFSAPGFRSVMRRLGMTRIELDVPPFARPDTFALADLSVDVWTPFAYVAKGRICKIGSLQRESADKFAPAGACHRECLGVLEVGAAPAASGLVSYARGNTQYYRHDKEMGAALRASTEAGHVSRLILAGI